MVSFTGCTAGEVLGGSSKVTEINTVQKSITQLQHALAGTFRYVNDVVVSPVSFASSLASVAMTHWDCL